MHVSSQIIIPFCITEDHDKAIIFSQKALFIHMLDGSRKRQEINTNAGWLLKGILIMVSITEFIDQETEVIFPSL